jgi:hypothetical protein
MHRLVEALCEIAAYLSEQGLGERVEPLRREARLAVQAVERYGHFEEDVEPIRSEARAAGLLPPPRRREEPQPTTAP